MKSIEGITLAHKGRASYRILRSPTKDLSLCSEHGPTQSSFSNHKCSESQAWGLLPILGELHPWNSRQEKLSWQLSSSHKNLCKFLASQKSWPLLSLWSLTFQVSFLWKINISTSAYDKWVTSMPITQEGCWDLKLSHLVCIYISWFLKKRPFPLRRCWSRKWRRIRIFKRHWDRDSCQGKMNTTQTKRELLDQ